MDVKEDMEKKRLEEVEVAREKAAEKGEPFEDDDIPAVTQAGFAAEAKRRAIELASQMCMSYDETNKRAGR